MITVVRGHKKCNQCIYYRKKAGCVATMEEMERAMVETGIDCLSESDVIYALGAKEPSEEQEEARC